MTCSWPWLNLPRSCLTTRSNLAKAPHDTPFLNAGCASSVGRTCHSSRAQPLTNGAHLQPWTWVAIRSAELQVKLREAAEEEEQKTYAERMPEAWSEVLENWAPMRSSLTSPMRRGSWCCSSRRNAQRENGEWGPTYYATESCGIAAGMFIQAVHTMGLVTHTHTRWGVPSRNSWSAKARGSHARDAGGLPRRRC